jgi:hypothetical protein
MYYWISVLCGGEIFAHDQTGPGAHPAFCTMGTGSFRGVKRPGRGTDQPPLLAPRSRKSKSIPQPPPPLWAFGPVTGYLYLYLLNGYQWRITEIKCISLYPGCPGFNSRLVYRLSRHFNVFSQSYANSGTVAQILTPRFASASFLILCFLFVA